MELKVDAKGYGFTIKRMTDIPEQNACMIEMEHDATGARLIWMKSEERNKLFSVAFKTVPENSTGVFHILEHSVLCGSAKYPVREPFVELLKSSMQTFLNAITFPDKTMYPISSRNEQDFLNLTEVYLDAVFAPAILTNPNIFYQEGWHIELDEEGKPSYKGVVLNEMKGATSNVDEQIGQHLVHMLFSDSCYGFNSGGEPKDIPTLTYEKFCSEYHRYYSASNAYFYLDGDIPFDKTMKLIESYLDKQVRVENLPEIPFTDQSSEPDVEEEFYAVGPDENTETQAHLVFGRIVGRYDEKTRLTAAQILLDVLTGSNEAPLTKAILSAGLAQNVEADIQSDGLQPFLIVALKNTSKDNFAKLRELLFGTLKEIGKKGLSKEAMRASLNAFAFQVKQPREPQGLMRNIRTLNSWLYGGKPEMWLSFTDTIAAIRQMIEDGSMDQLYAEIFLKEEAFKELRMLPSATLTQQLQQEEDERLAKITGAWSEADFEACRRMNEKLVSWQATPDTKEQIETLPTLSLSDVKADIDWVETKVCEAEGVKLLYHPVPTNGIVHLRLYFSLGDQSKDDLMKLSILPELLENLPTENYPDPLKLQETLKTYLGSLSFDVEVYGSDKNPALCKPCFTVKCSVLEENLDKAFELIPEVLLRTSFSDQNAAKNILLQLNEIAKQYIIGRGNMYAMMLAEAPYSAKAAVAEATGGYTRDLWLKGLVQNLEESLAPYLSYLEEKMKAIFTNQRLVLSETASREVDVKALLRSFPEGNADAIPENASYTSDLPDHTAVVIPAQVGYAASAYHLSKTGRKADGSLAVVSNILSLDYLWNRVRVQGGAYGTGFRVGREGRMVVYSYRDPSPAKSLQVYKQMAQALKEFADRGEAFDKYIISTIGEMDPLLMPAQRGMIADARYLNGTTKEEILNMLEEMLKTSKEDLLSWTDVLEEMGEKGRTAVVGHEAAIKECPDAVILG